MSPRPLVLVTVGTDHHRFDRLMDWMERWLEDGPPVRCVAQHGSSRAPAGAECHPVLPHDELKSLFESADLVVCQAGPGGIVESRAAGRLPIAVPRVPGLDEIVDDHQLLFARRMAELGRVALAESADELFAHLAKGLKDPDAYVVAGDDEDTDAAVARFAELVDPLITAPRRFWSRRR